jgi:hypothetical protein
MIAQCARSFAAILMCTGLASAQESPPSRETLRERVIRSTDLGDVMLIVDFSQSMWNEVDGRRKHETAADATQVLLDTLNKFSAESGITRPVGLMLYGHRTPAARKNCSDIEIVVPPRPVSDAAHRNQIMGVVRRTQPRGMTPIGASLRQAAEALKYRERPVTLILVSDGIESCNADPCAEARRLHEQGVRLVAHVVGYAVKSEEFEKLKCIADATHGLATLAPRAADLDAGLRDVARSIRDEALKRVTGSLAIDVVDSAGRALTAADFDAPAEILVETTGEDTRHLKLTGETQLLSTLAAPYRVRLQGGRQYAAVDIQVAPATEARARLQVGDGKLEALFLPAVGAPPFPATDVAWQITRGSVNATTASAVNPAAFALAPGGYVVAANMGAITGTGAARILPDGTTRVEIMPQPPFAQLVVRLVQPLPTLFAATKIPHRLRVVAVTPSGEIEFARGSDAVTVYVPPGQVRVPWMAGDRSGEMEINVPASGTSRVEMLSLPTVEWSVEWSGDSAAEPFTWVIEELLDSALTGERETRAGDKIAGTIPPGSYRVTVSRGSVETTADITVVSGLSERQFLLRERL